MQTPNSARLAAATVTKVHDTERSRNATTNQTATAPSTLTTMPLRCASTIKTSENTAVAACAAMLPIALAEMNAESWSRRDEHIGRAGGDRQRGDDRADGRAGALGHHRRGDDEAGGDGHLENEREPENQVGGHRKLSAASSCLETALPEAAFKTPMAGT